jgi:hypothetical protein
MRSIECQPIIAIGDSDRGPGVWQLVLVLLNGNATQQTRAQKMKPTGTHITTNHFYR